MTEKLYESDSFLHEWNAQVLSCRKEGECYVVLLDRTAFFPEGGGQKADTGTIGAAKVMDVKESECGILHYTDREILPGETVACCLDWLLRFARMQNHTAEHIVSGTVYRHFGYHNVGFHMDEDSVTVDFDGTLDEQAVAGVEREVNRILWENRRVRAYYPAPDELKTLEYRMKKPISGAVRIVTIDGADCCACCAPHLNTTAQAGIVKLYEPLRHRGGTRLVMRAGEWAQNDYCEKYRNVRDIARRLCVKQKDAFVGVERMIDEMQKEKLSHEAFTNAVVTEDAESAVPSNGTVCFFSKRYDTRMLRDFVNTVLPRCEKYAAAFSGTDEDGYTYIIAGHSSDMKQFTADFHAALPGRGGGRDGMIQGRVTAPKEQIIAFFGK